MAHELENMFYIGEAPWHKLGKKLNNAPTIKEGIIWAGLDWSVALEPLYLQDGTLTEANATVRSSDRSILGIVGNRYTVLQNRDAFNWFEPFLDLGIELESAGSLQGGRKVWILAKIPGTLEIVKNDIVDKYVLLTNSHDGSMAIHAGFTPIRVVCMNTLNMSISKKGSKLLKVKHTISANNTLNDIRESMNIINQEFECTKDKYQSLSKKVINPSKFKEIVHQVLKVDPKEVISTRTKNNIHKIEDLFEYGKGQDMEGVKGTAWAAYNAFTEYFTYFATSDDDKRLTSTWYGENQNKSMKALDLLLVA